MVCLTVLNRSVLPFCWTFRGITFDCPFVMGLEGPFPPSCVGEGQESEFGQKQKNSHTFLEVCLCIILELEEVRRFSCSDTSYGRVVLVGVIFASKLSVVNFYFSLRRAEPEPQDCERMKHAASNLFTKIGVVEPLFWFVLGGRGGAMWPSLDLLSLSFLLLWLLSFPSSSLPSSSLTYSAGRRLLVSRHARQDGSGPHASGRSVSGVRGLRRRATS